MSERPRVAVIGAGNMGKNHLRVYSEIEEVELVAFADQNPANQDLAERYDITMYGDYRDMIGSESVDAVSIVTPTPTHLRMAEFMIANGVHVLIEKPIAGTAEDADKIIELAKSGGVTVTIGHIERFNPVVKATKRLIDSGSLGEVLTIDCVRIGGFPNAEPPSDVISDLAIHDIDIMRYLTGKHFEVVGAHGSRTVHSKELDSAQILLAANGVGGTTKANWITPTKVRTISVTGSKGHLEANYLTQQLRIFERGVPISSDYESLVEAAKLHEERFVDLETAEPLRRELRGFLGAFVASLSSELDLVQLDDAREALRLALDAKDFINGELAA